MGIKDQPSPEPRVLNLAEFAELAAPEDLVQGFETFPATTAPCLSGILGVIRNSLTHCSVYGLESLPSVSLLESYVMNHNLPRHPARTIKAPLL